MVTAYVQSARIQVVEAYVQGVKSVRTKLTNKTYVQYVCTRCTQPKTPALLNVFNFTGLFQLVNKLQQTCEFYQVATSLLKSGLLQLVICRLLTTLSCTCKSVENFQKTIHVSCVQELRVLITDIET